MVAKNRIAKLITSTWLSTVTEPLLRPDSPVYKPTLRSMASAASRPHSICPARTYLKPNQGIINATPRRNNRVLDLVTHMLSHRQIRNTIAPHQTKADGARAVGRERVISRLSHSPKTELALRSKVHEMRTRDRLGDSRSKTIFYQTLFYTCFHSNYLRYFIKINFTILK